MDTEQRQLGFAWVPHQQAAIGGAWTARVTYLAHFVACKHKPGPYKWGRNEDQWFAKSLEKSMLSLKRRSQHRCVRPSHPANQGIVGIVGVDFPVEETICAAKAACPETNVQDLEQDSREPRPHGAVMGTPNLLLIIECCEPKGIYIYYLITHLSLSRTLIRCIERNCFISSEDLFNASMLMPVQYVEPKK